MTYSVFYRRSSAFIRCSHWIHIGKGYEMRKGFTRKPKADEPATPVKNYITRSGLQRLKDEHRFLLTRERPAVTEVVAWAASNGDRSDNADYRYGKRRLRQIDGRIRFLTKRIEAAEVVDPEAPRAGQAATRAFFGATVRYANAAGVSRVVSIVGTAEIDLNRNHISWVSPLGPRQRDSLAEPIHPTKFSEAAHERGPLQLWRQHPEFLAVVFQETVDLRNPSDSGKLLCSRPDPNSYGTNRSIQPPVPVGP